MSVPQRSLAVWSIPVAVAVLALKLGAWMLTGSVALLSDALESIVNVAAAVMAWYALKVAERPSDHDHPFGHHKAEYLSAVAEGVMIIIAALLIVRAAVGAFTHPSLDAAPWAGLLVNIAAGLLNGLWARALIAQGRARKSPALVASGRHLMTDVWTSVGVVGGIAVAALTGWVVLDAALALLVALHILREGYFVIRDSVDGLMDHGAGEDETARIEAVVRATAAGALQIHRVRTRRAGPRLFVEFHLVVPGTMSVAAAHAICDRIELAMAREIPGSSTHIHVEPDYKIEQSGIVPDASDLLPRSRAS